MTYQLITVHTPSADMLAEELGQRLISTRVVSEGFELTAYNSHANLEFPNVSSETLEKTMVEASDWLKKKHPNLMHRRVSGKRTRQNLGIPHNEGEEVVCLEIRK